MQVAASDLDYTQIAISSIEYTKARGETISHLFGVDEKGKFAHKQVHGINPFFYVRDGVPIPQNAQIKEIINVAEQGWRDIKGNKVKKVEMVYPDDVGGNRRDKAGFRDRFKQNVTYEDDIEFRTRIAIELGIKSGVRIKKGKEHLYYGADYIEPVEFKKELRRWHIDIETSSYESGGNLARWENPVNPIWCITVFDTYKLKFISFIWSKHYDNGKRYDAEFVNPFSPEMQKKYPQFKAKYPWSIYTFKTEKQMLNCLLDFVNDWRPHIATGWNGKLFDFPYLVARMQYLQLKVKRLSPINSVWLKDDGLVSAKGLILFDTWDGFRKTLTSERESNKLDDVAFDLFGVGKVKHGGIDELHAKDRDTLLRYNATDVFLEYAIGESQNVFGFFYGVKTYSGCHYEDVFNNSRIVDVFFLFVAKEQKIVLPSKRDREGKKYKGATVIQPPRKGLQEFVLILDLAALYPMCMVTLNMGEDTIVVNPPQEQIPYLIRSPVKGVYFRKDKPSFVAGVISQLIAYRKEIKLQAQHYEDIGDEDNKNIYKRLQTVVKFIANSIYGVLGWARFRLYNRAIASAITATARVILNYSIKVVQKLGWIIYYGDTDSMFLLLTGRTREQMIVEMEQLEKAIARSYNVFLKLFNIDKHFFDMRAEKIYETMLMVMKKTGDVVAKKRYAGVKIGEETPDGSWKWLSEPKLDIKGFDRSDMSRVGKITMKRVIEMACYRKDVKEITEYLSGILAKVKNREYTLFDLGFSKGIRRMLNTYKNQDWIRAARWTNRFSSLWHAQTNFTGGSKPKFVYLLKDLVPAPYDPIEVVALDDNYYLPDHLAGIIDYKTLIQKTIQSKVEQVTDAIGIEWKHVFSPAKSTSIFRRGANVAT